MKFLRRYQVKSNYYLVGNQLQNFPPKNPAPIFIRNNQVVYVIAHQHKLYVCSFQGDILCKSNDFESLDECLGPRSDTYFTLCPKSKAKLIKTIMGEQNV